MSPPLSAQQNQEDPQARYVRLQQQMRTDAAFGDLVKGQLARREKSVPLPVKPGDPKGNMKLPVKPGDHSKTVPLELRNWYNNAVPTYTETIGGRG